MHTWLLITQRSVAASSGTAKAIEHDVERLVRLHVAEGGLQQFPFQGRPGPPTVAAVRRAA